MIRTRPQSSPANRNGSSLVEVVIAMTIASVVLSLGMGMLHLLMRSETAMSDSLQRSQTVSQLSRQFRNDIHAARSANIETPPKDKPQAKPVLKLQLAPNHQVRYAALDHAILRTESQGDKTLQTVRFRFSKGSVIDFSQEFREPSPHGVDRQVSQPENLPNPAERTDGPVAGTENPSPAGPRPSF